MDSGALSLDKVFELITEVEGLPVCLERELKVTLFFGCCITKCLGNVFNHFFFHCGCSP